LKIRNFALPLAFAVLSTFAASAQSAAAQGKPVAPGIQPDNMDTSVKPGDNFYLYANGDWIKRTVIPPDRGSVGVFSVLADQSSKNTRAIIEETAKSNPAPGSNARKIASLPSSHISPPSPPSRTRSSWPTRSASLSAPTSMPSTTPTSTPQTSSDCGSRPDFRIAITTPPICCRAVSSFPTANTTSPTTTT